MGDIQESERKRNAYIDGILAECEAEGVDFVRLRYNALKYPAFALDAVREWLSTQDQEERLRNERSQAEQSKTARDAKNAAIVAAIAAIIAVPLAITSIIISYLAWVHPHP